MNESRTPVKLGCGNVQYPAGMLRPANPLRMTHLNETTAACLQLQFRAAYPVAIAW
jgi:hypothetical protein